MKWRSLFLLILVALFCLSGCNDRVPNEEKIKDDIVAKEKLDRSDVTIMDYSVIKRQTNKADKNDIIYMTISGENDDYTFVKNYKATYCLYNDGWQLEELSPFYDYEEGIVDSIVPKHGVENPEDYLDFIFSDHSLDPLGVSAEQLSWASWPDDVYSVSTGELQHGEMILDSEYSTDMYYLPVTYNYFALTEEATIPINFTFDTYDWSWSMYIDSSSAKRTLTLSDGIIGKWTSHYPNSITSFFGVDVYISSHTDDTCEVDSYTWVYSDAEYTTSGTMRLSYSINDETGKIVTASLQWDGDVPNSKACGPLSFSSVLGLEYLHADRTVGTSYKLANISK